MIRKTRQIDGLPLTTALEMAMSPMAGSEADTAPGLELLPRAYLQPQDSQGKASLKQRKGKRWKSEKWPD